MPVICGIIKSHKMTSKASPPCSLPSASSALSLTTTSCSRSRMRRTAVEMAASSSITSTRPLRDGGYRYATFICYEDILPWIVRKTMQDHGEGRAHALVNLTNDSWYGAGHEQEQHLQLAALRTIEHRRWLLRATSTGISAFVDASGRVVQSIPKDLRGVSIREVPMLQGTTPYEIVGDWPGWLSLAVLAFIAVREWRKRRLSAAPSTPSAPTR